MVGSGTYMKPAFLKPLIMPFAAAFLSSSDPLRKREKSMSCIMSVGWHWVRRCVTTDWNKQAVLRHGC